MCIRLNSTSASSSIASLPHPPLPNCLILHCLIIQCLILHCLIASSSIASSSNASSSIASSSIASMPHPPLPHLSHVKAALKDSPVDWLQSSTSAIGRQSLWWSSSGCFLTSILPFFTVTTRDFPRVLHDAHAYCDAFFLWNLYENPMYLSLLIMSPRSDWVNTMYSLSEIHFQRELKIDPVSLDILYRLYDAIITPASIWQRLPCC